AEAVNAQADPLPFMAVLLLALEHGKDHPRGALHHVIITLQNIRVRQELHHTVARLVPVLARALPLLVVAAGSVGPLLLFFAVFGLFSHPSSSACGHACQPPAIPPCAPAPPPHRHPRAACPRAGPRRKCG